MKSKIIAGVLMALALTGVATAASVGRPQHGGQSQVNHPNYLRGPICADRNTGLLRWIEARQKCLKNETRLLIPLPKRGLPGRGVAGPAGATGPVGPAGVAGAQGAKGDAGAKGEQGLPGEGGAVGATGPQGEKGATGADSQVAGPKGDVGPSGPAGAQGASGPAGPKGPTGPAGLGDGKRWLCYDGNAGGGVHDGGAGNAPVCNNGSKLAYQVVTFGSPIVNP